MTLVQNRLENGHGQNVRAHASWVPSWLNQPTRNLARTQHKQMGPSVTHASLTRLCRRVAHMQVLGLTPNCLPIPKLSRTPNGKTIAGVSRETHNTLTHSLTLLMSHISLSLSLSALSLPPPDTSASLISSSYRRGDVCSTHTGAVRSQRRNVERVKPLWSARANFGDEALVLHATRS